MEDLSTRKTSQPKRKTLGALEMAQLDHTVVKKTASPTSTWASQRLSSVSLLKV
jgi:hypothetical protein